MVKKTFSIALSAFLLNTIFLCAGDFTASVSSRQVYSNENFTLNLSLKNGSPKGSPVINELKKDFVINSEQQSTNTTFVNGKVSSSITWKLSLTPKVDGVIQLPSISVDTSDGVLSTQPITLNVVKGSPQNPKDDSIGLNIITKVSNAAPYKNEPITYTAILTSKVPIYNVQTQKMQVNDAIIELLGEPKLEERNIGGVSQNVVEFTYLITPLKSGSLTIPSIAIQGAVPQKKKKQVRSFFDDDFDSFGFIQGIDRLKPFTLMAEEIQLDVQSPVLEVSPWLPAKALSLEEQWSKDQTLRVGEPFSRSFAIKGEGIKASQLPHLDDLQNEGSNYKVYADKPEEQEKMFEGIMHSSRKEQFTYIPNQAGTLILPEISVNWWDTNKKEKRNATIPARTVTILPSLATNVVSQELPLSPLSTVQEPYSSSQTPYFLYSIIGILGFLLTGALLWGYTLQRKIKSLTMGPSQKTPFKNPFPQPLKEVKKEKKEKLPDLNPT